MNYRLRQLLALAKENAFVAVCLVVIVLAGGICLIFSRQNLELERKQVRVRNEGETAKRMVNASVTLHNDAQIIEAALKEIDASLVTEDNLSDNLGYFFIIEEKTQAHIDEVHQSPTTAVEVEGKYKTVPVTLTVKGTFAQAFDFLYKVETGSRLIKISTFTIHRSEPTGDAVTLALDLNMLAYP
jgi:Tfp pilus assembly protein PilO